MEQELKLEFDPADHKALRSAGPLPAAKGETRRLVSTYFDTPESDLQKAGFSLRIRRIGRQHIQTVKTGTVSAAGMFRREEWERPVRGARPELDGKDSPLAGKVGRSALARIAPVFVTDVKRMTATIDQEDAIVELAVDAGEVRAGDVSERLSELELELRGGSPAALFDLARQLNEEVPLRLGVRSKSERGYALAAGERPQAVKAEPVLFDPDRDAGDAFRAIAMACIRHFRLNETLLMASGDAEPLHQARVGLRRLRSAFSLCKPLLHADGKTELLSVELRWLAAQLGEVRNLDVLIPRFRGDIRDRLAAARERGFARVRAELASARTRLLMIDLIAWLSTGDWRAHPPDPERLHQNVAAFAGDLLADHRKRLKRRGKGLADLDDAHRHKVRIEAKKLRYAAEFFGSLYAHGKAARRHGRFLKALEGLQDQLGELNDLVIGPGVLAKHGIEATLPHSGKHRRRRLLEKAERAFDTLMAAKSFWRG